MPRRNRDVEQIQPLIDAFLGLNRRQQMIVVAAIALLLVGLAIFYYQNQQRLTHQAAESPQMLLGNPSNATANLFDRTNYLMPKPWYCLSYNDSTGTPNWVSWQVVADDLGTAPRKPDFDTDESLPSTFYHVTTRDYSGSGFDRGHMCPHSDRAATEEMSFSTFIMTNIIPQAPNVNRKAWCSSRSIAESSSPANTTTFTSSPVRLAGEATAAKAPPKASGPATSPFPRPAGKW